MASRITGAYETRTKIDIQLPYDKNGDPAFDKDGKPLKNVEPVTITLPLWNYMPRDQLKELIRVGAEHEAQQVDTPADVVDKQCDGILASLRLFVDDDQYLLLEELRYGELLEINATWTNASQETTLGESRASAASSMSTQRR
jgi:hypothetical protein